jgi:hypothetical protein
VLLLAYWTDLSLNEKGIDFECFGTLTTAITYSYGRNNRRTAFGGGDIFRALLQTGTQGKETHYGRGSITRFPFQFQVPPDAPSTFRVQGNSSRGEVAYGIAATAHVSGMLTRNLHARVQLIVDPLFTKRSPTPDALAPSHGTQAVEVPKWGCFSCGGTEGVQLEATIPRSVYANGDIIPVELEVTNNRTSIPRGLVVTLTQIYTVRAEGLIREIYNIVSTVQVQTDAHREGAEGAPARSILHVQVPVQHLLPDTARPDITRRTVLEVHVQASKMYGATVRPHESKTPSCREAASACVYFPNVCL